MRATALFPLILTLLAGASSVEDPVTHMGEHILPKTDLVARGRAGRPRQLPNGANLVRFRIEEVLCGVETREAVLLVTAAPDLVPPKDLPAVLFLGRLGRGRYDPVGRVDLAGADAKDREDTLRRYLEIESLSDGKRKRRALKNLLLGNLESKRRFLVYSAARELANFTRKNGKTLGDADRVRIRKARAGTTDPLLKELLDTALKNLDAGALPPKKEKKRSTDPQGPAYREVRRLLAAWRKSPERAAQRLDILVRLTAKYLKFSGDVLVAALEDRDAEVRRHAALYLGEGEFRNGVPPLCALLGKERERAVLSAAIHSLGILRAKEALPEILELGRRAEFRRAAAFAAARIGGELAKEWLEGLVAAHSGPGEEDAEIRSLVSFLESEAFRKQEKTLEKIRKKRLE